jgi:outer membrane protein insertion porin family
MSTSRWCGPTCRCARAGDLDETMLDRDIRALYKTGLFEFIEIKREAVDASTFNLVVEVTPKYRVLAVVRGQQGRVKTTGSPEVKTKVNTALDERQVKEDSEKIREYYQKLGYNQVSVTYTVHRDRATGFGTITFRIREGNRVKIRLISFIGNAHIKTKTLRSQMDTKPVVDVLLADGHGPLQGRRLPGRPGQAARLLPRARLPRRRDPRGADRLRLSQAGQPGHHDRSRGGPPVPHRGDHDHGQQAPFDGAPEARRRALREARRRLLALGGSTSRSSGSRTTTARTATWTPASGSTAGRTSRTNNIDIEYKIDESEKFNIESIQIEGNTKTKSVVIIRELVLGPGDVFDKVRMKISKNRLQNTRFFDDVDITDQDTNIPAGATCGSR